jgi:hypothetical protein
VYPGGIGMVTPPSGTVAASISFDVMSDPASWTAIGVSGDAAVSGAVAGGVSMGASASVATSREATGAASSRGAGPSIASTELSGAFGAPPAPASATGAFELHVQAPYPSPSGVQVWAPWPPFVQAHAADVPGTQARC